MLSSKFPAPPSILFLQFLYLPVILFRTLSLSQALCHLSVFLNIPPEGTIRCADKVRLSTGFADEISMLNITSPDGALYGVFHHRATFITNDFHMILL